VTAPLNTAEAPSIETLITYLAPGSFINRRFVAPGREVNTGEYLPYAVTIHDAKPRTTDFTLASHGLMLTRHASSVRNFFDKERVDATCPAEVAEAIQHITGADRVATAGWMIGRRAISALTRGSKVVLLEHDPGRGPVVRLSR